MPGVTNYMPYVMNSNLKIKDDNQANHIFVEKMFKPEGEPRDSVHFVTTLTGSYIPGITRLLESIEQNSKLDTWDITVIPLDEEALKFQHPRIVHRIGMSDERKKIDLRTVNPRFAPNFNKLTVWSIPLDEVYIFIDVDIMCLGDLNELRYWKPNITVVRNFVLKEKSRREESSYKVGTLPIFNSGVFCFQPNPAIHEELVKYTKKYKASGVHLGDQEILNDFFATHYGSRMQYASYAYNYRTALSKAFLHPRSYTHGTAFKEDPKLLHFIHPVKPWMEGDCKDHQVDAFALWKKKISLEEFLTRDRKSRGVK